MGILEPQIHDQIIAILNEFLGGLRIKVEHTSSKIQRDPSPDLIISSREHFFVIKIRSVASGMFVADGVQQLRKYCNEIKSKAQKTIVPLLVVPFMGEVGRTYCEEAEVSWLDLSGNAEIRSKGILISIKGRDNKFKKPGPAENVFSWKSSRIARRFLLFPGSKLTQREMAIETGLDEGYVSKIIKRMEQDGYVKRALDRKIQLSDPGVLLDDWHESYEFSKQDQIQGHIPARSGEELMDKLKNLLIKTKIKHSFTGLAAAWLYTEFAMFRLVSVYVENRHLLEKNLKEIGFNEESRGANTWFVFPKDEYIWKYARTKGGHQYVDPVQVFLDLKEHPERAEEAAAEIRKIILG